MRKPSDLKILITNLINEYSRKCLKTENESDRVSYELVLDILFRVQEICENRKKY